MEEDGESLSSELKEDLQKLDRHKMGIWEIRARWGREVAISFKAASGLIAQEKAKNSTYDESLAEKIKECQIGIERSDNGKFGFASPWGTPNYILGTINYENGCNITVKQSYRERDSKVPYLADQLGWLCSREGKVDDNQEITIDSSKADTYRKLNSLTIDTPNNKESIDTILVLFEEKIMKGQKVITITEAEKKTFLSMIGIPNGYATPFLAEFRSGPNERLFGETEVTKISIQLVGFLGSETIDEIRNAMHYDIDSDREPNPLEPHLKIKKITYYFLRKSRPPPSRGTAGKLEE